MNKKLIKLEFKETKKMFILFIAVLLLYQTISIFLGSISRNVQSTVPNNMMIILTLCSGLGILSAAIFMLKRFYNILFSSEGLIRLAMPVKNSAHQKVNVFVGLVLIYILFAIFITGIGLSEVSSGEYYGVANAYRNTADLYAMAGFTGPGFEAAITIILYVIAFMVIVANFYISCVFAITIAGRIAGKFNIIQKSGVLFIVMIVLFLIKFLIIENIYTLFGIIEDMANNDLIHLNEFTYILCDNVFFIIVYGLSALAMYQISKTILDKKLDI